MSSRPPKRVKELRDRCRQGIANLPDEELLVLSHFIIENEDINNEAWRDLARELMIQIQWEKDARIRRQDAIRTQEQQDRIHRRQHTVNLWLAIIATVSLLVGLGSLWFQYKADCRAATQLPAINSSPSPPSALPAATKTSPTDTLDRSTLQAPPPAPSSPVPPAAPQ